MGLFLFALGYLLTRKRVKVFLDRYLIRYFVFCKLISDILRNYFLVPPYCKIPESKRESYDQSQLKIPFQIKRNDHSHPLHEVFHAGDGNAVAEGFVARGVRSAGNIGPAIWVPLEPFALQRCEAANEIPAVRIPGRGRLADEVCSVLVLPRALRGGDLIIPELIYPLAGIDAVAIRGGQGTAERVVVFHHLVVAHAGRTSKSGNGENRSHLRFVYRLC